MAQSYLDYLAGRDPAEVAAAFHETIAAGAAAACAELGEPRTVVPSGGSFQNLRLLASRRRRLEQLGFRVLTHRLVPPKAGSATARPRSRRPGGIDSPRRAY